MMDDQDLPNREGECLKSKYLLEKRLGIGGMGEVYRARNIMIDRIVAIKMLHKELAAHQNVVDRFLMEARAANFVQHPNVVEVLDIDTDETGVPFIVQEYLEGEDLGTRLEKHSGKMPHRTVLRMLLPVIKAIGVAHEKGVVHRDLKPENIFLAWQGNRIIPKVLDFGISKMPVKKGSTRLTMDGTMLGSPAYMSPEQIQDAQSVDCHADVWAIGVMLYRMLSGKLPFDADSPSALFVKICTTYPVPLEEVQPDIPKELTQVVGRCLAREPNERFKDANELYNFLNEVLAQAGANEPASEKEVAAETARTAPTVPGFAKPDIKPAPPAPTAAARPEKAEISAPAPLPQTKWGDLHSPKKAEDKAPISPAVKEPRSASAPQPVKPAGGKAEPMPERVPVSSPRQAAKPRAAVKPHPAVKPQPFVAKSPAISSTPDAEAFDNKSYADMLQLGGFIDIFVATLLVVAVVLSVRYLGPTGWEEIKSTMGANAFLPFTAMAIVFFTASIPLAIRSWRASSIALLVADIGLIIVALSVSISAWSLLDPQSTAAVIRPLASSLTPWAAAAIPGALAAFGLFQAKEEVQKRNTVNVAKGVVVFALSLAAILVALRLGVRAFRGEEPPVKATPPTSEPLFDDNLP